MIFLVENALSANSRSRVASKHELTKRINENQSRNFFVYFRTLVYNDLSNKIVTFTTESAPPEQRKKVTLLLYFIQYMNEHLINSEELTSSVASSYSNAVFMKKWFRTDKAVVMYLNNGTLQVIAFHLQFIVTFKWHGRY